MKALQCEMCGSQDLVKDGGVFVCQSCGTRYSVEEAKKMMIEGTVDVKGTVKVDKSQDAKNLVQLAKDAIESVSCGDDSTGIIFGKIPFFTITGIDRIVILVGGWFAIGHENS